MEQPIELASIVGERLIVSYLKDASSLARTFDLAGNELAPVELAGIGSVTGLHRRSPAIPRRSTASRASTARRRSSGSTPRRVSTVFAAPEISSIPSASRSSSGSTRRRTARGCRCSSSAART
jgi:prolyl oligopeptidase